MGDKGESGRKKAFKLLQRLEHEKDGKLLEELMSNKWDNIITKKFANFKKLEKRKKSAKSGNKIKEKNSKKNIKFQLSKESILEEPDKENEKNEEINLPTTTTITITSDDDAPIHYDAQ